MRRLAPILALLVLAALPAAAHIRTASQLNQALPSSLEAEIALPAIVTHAEDRLEIFAVKRKLASGIFCFVVEPNIRQTRELGTESWQGHDYMHARYYNPNFARFLSTDPGRDWNPKAPQSWNLYSYVRNNPTGRRDPTGKYTCSGSKDDCGQVAESLALVRKSAESLPKGSQERARVSAIVNLYGKPGQKNGVVVDTSGKGRIPGAAGGASMEGKTLKFSVSIAEVKDQVSGFPNADLKAELAGVLTHDGQHLFDFKQAGKMFETKTEELAGETRAGFTEAFMWQGLGQDASSEIYTNATGVNPEAIRFYAERATAMWCAAGGNCE